ncbi:MAG: hypothetical protein K2M30_04810, partial [Desulfovibrionaceae bacterium]|nr:hypothetical protein [Desulfovibrionaceae bacterium]
MQYRATENIIVQPIEVTWEELYQQFCLIFDSIDYKEAYDILRLRSYHFLFKRKVKNEIKAIVLSLWRLSLQITFSEQSEYYFEQAYVKLRESKRVTKEIEEIYAIYWREVQRKLNTDFIPPADIMKIRLQLEKRKIHTITLALYMRSLYQYIHEYLIDISLE